MITVRLSKDHETLSLAELKAVLEAECGEYRLRLDEDTAFVEADLDPSILENRLGMAKSVNGKELEQGFHERMPRFRPFRHPSAMDPKLARVMVNLSRVKAREKLLDPFCGTGGILLEGALIGCNVAGIELDLKILEGCRGNLEHYNIADFMLTPGDMRSHYIDCDAIATDPPYGKSTQVGHEVLEKFYEGAMKAMQNDLKGGRHLCISSPETLQIRNIAESLGFSTMEEHIYYVNKSMNKRICVFKNGD
jgi:tRNA (guanine10-N2)-dimethyltransferase